MTHVIVRIDAHTTTVHVDGADHVLPVGPQRFSDTEFHSDPPRPEELTNAIGLATDYVDDLARSIPSLAEGNLEVVVIGREMTAIAAVEAGHAVELPFALSREAIEDVFRTLATEPTPARAQNPGLESALVATVVGGCCVLVAIVRRLQLDHITVIA